MAIGATIHGLLSGDATFASYTGTRIYPNVAAQNAAFPYAVYSVIGTQPTDTKDGVSKLDIVRVQVDVYSQNYDTSQTMAARARTVLDRFSGSNNGNNIDKIIFTNQADAPYNDELNVWWVSQDYEIRIKL